MHLLLLSRVDRYPGVSLNGRTVSNRIWDVDEFVCDAKPRRYELAETPYTEGLRRVMAGRDEVDAALSGVGHRVLRRLPREQAVEAEADSLRNRRRARAGDDPDRANHRRPVTQDEWFRRHAVADPRHELLCGDA